MPNPLDILNDVWISRMLGAGQGGQQPDQQTTGSAPPQVPDLFGLPDQQADQTQPPPLLGSGQPTEPAQQIGQAPAPIPPEVLQQALALQAALLGDRTRFLSNLSTGLGLPNTYAEAAGGFPVASPLFNRALSPQAVRQNVTGILSPTLSALPAIEALFNGSGAIRGPDALRAAGLRPDRFGIVQGQRGLTPDVIQLALQALQGLLSGATG